MKHLQIIVLAVALLAVSQTQAGQLTGPQQVTSYTLQQNFILFRLNDGEIKDQNGQPTGSTVGVVRTSNPLFDSIDRALLTSFQDRIKIILEGEPNSNNTAFFEVEGVRFQ